MPGHVSDSGGRGHMGECIPLSGPHPCYGPDNAAHTKGVVSPENPQALLRGSSRKLKLSGMWKCYGGVAQAGAAPSMSSPRAGSATTLAGRPIRRPMRASPLEAVPALSGPCTSLGSTPSTAQCQWPVWAIWATRDTRGHDLFRWGDDRAAQPRLPTGRPVERTPHRRSRPRRSSRLGGQVREPRGRDPLRDVAHDWNPRNRQASREAVSSTISWT